LQRFSSSPFIATSTHYHWTVSRGQPDRKTATRLRAEFAACLSLHRFWVLAYSRSLNGTWAINLKLRPRSRVNGERGD
jgi:hypothetical protein